MTLKELIQSARNELKDSYHFQFSAGNIFHGKLLIDYDLPEDRIRHHLILFLTHYQKWSDTPKSKALANKLWQRVHNGELT